ncbi:regulatory protein GemA [Acidimangrovimonas sediminis]|uniref:regulatory protein GemA n=1 Tax=Acidimangrovimonas sediminis TaxID=2056283 RepID=UPI000C804BB4|nr:regulatory protein GemA [Acidimangrovimonas sediminis]
MIRSLQRKIHLACRQLGLDQDTRHDLQLVVTGKASLRDMDEGELKAMVAALEARGFRKTAPTRKRYPRAPRADLRLVHVLWSRLGEAGALREPGRAGLNAFIRARFENSWGSVPVDVDALRDWDKIATVIDALKAMCARNGVEVDP